MTPIQAPPSSPRVQVGSELGNALHWLLNRAPRIYRIMEAWPGTSAMFTHVLNSIDLICHHEGISPEEFGRRFDPEITVDMLQRKIHIHLRDA